jgi:hypothetical protein
MPAAIGGPDSDYQADDDMRTLTRAEEIKADQDRIKRAAGKAKEHASNAKKVIALHKAGKISDKQAAKLGKK